MPTITVRIMPGKANEYQQKLWRTFWTRLVGAGRSELKAERRENG